MVKLEFTDHMKVLLYVLAWIDMIFPCPSMVKRAITFSKTINKMSQQAILYFTVSSLNFFLSSLNYELNELHHLQFRC